MGVNAGEESTGTLRGGAGRRSACSAGTFRTIGLDTLQVASQGRLLLALACPFGWRELVRHTVCLVPAGAHMTTSTTPITPRPSNEE
jgi:hypothetical protein